MISRVFVSLSRLVALVSLLSIPLALGAQAAAGVKVAPGVIAPPKWNIFLGYSYLSPHGSVTSSADPCVFLVVCGGVPTVKSVSYDSVSLAGVGSYSYFFKRNLGVQADVGVHEWGIQNKNPGGQPGTHGNNDGFTTVTGGVVYRFLLGNYTPFVHGLGGEADVDGPAHNYRTWGPAIIGGGGVDVDTPWFHHRLGIRLFEADYEYMHIDYAKVHGVADGGDVGINAVRLSAGVVYPETGEEPLAITLVCEPSPDTVYPGDPLTLRATAGNVKSKESVAYSWSGAGVKGSSAEIQVNTAPLAPGSYTVGCGVKEGQGKKPWQVAEASATFKVKGYDPPTISCTADPGNIKPNDKSTVTATGVSPQNRPLTYSYSAPAGTISGSGTTAQYDATGAPTGQVMITCNVSDDKGQTATANTSVTITAPYVPLPHTQALCSLDFTTDAARPARVNNEAKACLDEVALDLQKNPNAKVVLVGTSDAKEKEKTAHEAKLAEHNKHVKVTDEGADRAVNAKEYLVTEKGIDASRVSVATRATDGQSVGDYLVPSGANFTSDVSGTTPVDESTVKAQPIKPLPTGHSRP